MLTWLQEWYDSQCDGDWEHTYGVRIETLDNPGWLVRIDLVGTALEDKPFTTVVQTSSHVDWVHCSVKENIFEGAGGAHNLEQILRMFREWADTSGRWAVGEATG